MASFLEVAGRAFKYICGTLKEAYGSCVEVNESQRLRNEEMESKEAELKRKEESLLQKSKCLD